MLKANKGKIQFGLKPSLFSSHFDVKKLHVTLCITPVPQDYMYKTKHSGASLCSSPGSGSGWIIKAEKLFSYQIEIFNKNYCR